MKMLALTILLLSISSFSQAKSWKHNSHNDHSDKHNSHYFWQDIEKRQHDLHSNIDHGIKRGQLTHREIKKLKRERKHVSREIKHFKRHQYISRSNKRKILNHLEHYGAQIYDLKHNNHYSHKNRHDHHQYSHKNNRNEYKNRRHTSWANNNFSSGFYFKF
jgi:hypothetical protein